MEFPRMIYRVGNAAVLESGKYDFLVISEAEYESAIAEGWHLDQYAAKGAHEAANEPARPQQLPPVADDPPTREELEAKATELGLSFDGRTSDAKLAARIEEAMAAT